jgi:hypothetical protein
MSNKNKKAPTLKIKDLSALIEGKDPEIEVHLSMNREYCWGAKNAYIFKTPEGEEIFIIEDEEK